MHQIDSIHLLLVFVSEKFFRSSMSFAVHLLQLFQAYISVSLLSAEQKAVQTSFKASVSTFELCRRIEEVEANLIKAVKQLHVKLTFYLDSNTPLPSLYLKK